MPAFVAAILGGLLRIASTVAGRVLLSLGYSIVTFTGISATIGWLKTQAAGALVGLPADMVALLAFLKVGEAISIVVSAILVRQLLDSMSEGGSMRKLMQR